MELIFYYQCLAERLGAYPLTEEILFWVSGLFGLGDGSCVFLVCLRVNVDQEVHATADREVGATIYG